MGSNCSQADLGSNRSQILPNNESQCRELAKLNPEQQPQAWLEALTRTPGKKVPAASTVKAVVLEMLGIVQPVSQQNPLIPEFAPGNVCLLSAAKRSPLRPFDGMWGVVEYAEDERYTVRTGVLNN